MNLDQAVGKLYEALGQCREAPGYLQALQALGVVEESVEALNRSQRALKMFFSGEYDRDLHGAMICSAITENAKLLDP